MRKLVLFFCAVFISTIGFAQLVGDKYIPGAGGLNDYATIELAIADLNTQGVGTGGVNFNIAAGHTENITAPLLLTATGTAANPIVFQKDGAGANPLVTRTDNGSLVTSTAGGQGDAIIIIQGSDYVTFNGIDVGLSGQQGIEYGYLLRKASGTDGCKFVTIKNANITLIKGTTAYVMGVYLSNLDPASAVSSQVGVTVTSEGGRHENITITGNTISNVHHGIYARGFAHTTSPNNFLDQNLVIGAADGGTNTIQNFGGGSTITSHGVYMIYQTNPTVHYNIINNTAGGGSNATGILYGIFNTTSGALGALNVNNNEITLTQQSTSATYAIYSTIIATENQLNNNTIALTGTSTGSMYGIWASSSTQIVSFTGNEISSTQGGGVFYGYYNLGSPTAGTETIANNTISNVSIAAGTSVCYPIYSNTATGQNRVCYGNTVSNITHSGTGNIYGIYALSSNSNQIYNNNVYDITGGGATSGIFFSGTNPVVNNNNIYNVTSSGITINGVTNSGTGTTNMYKNKIYNISSTNAGPTVSGISLTTGTANSVYNNFISDIKAPVSGTDNSVRGINITSITANGTTGIYYNTIYLDATSTGANFGSTGLFHTYSATATSGTLDMRNNIIVNKGTANGTGKTVAFRRSSALNLDNYGATSNNNAFYAGTPSAAYVVFYDGTNFDSTMVDFKTRVSPRESVSFRENVPFVNSTTSPFDLTLVTNVPTQCESGAQTISTPSITDDYFGTTRNVSTPDVGAFEGNMTGQDLQAPLVVFTPLPNTPFTTPVTLTAQISDPSGVPQAGIGLPVLYWKINLAGTYAGVQGTYVLNDDYSFTFGSGVALGDTVFYYIVAQDNLGNVGATSSAGVVTYSADPPAVTPDPTNPNTYEIVASLSGPVTVGTGGDYETLTGELGLFQTMNGMVVVGDVIATIISDLTEPGTYALNQWAEAGTGGYTLTIKPDVTMRTITGTQATGSLIRFNGADRVTIDGSLSGGDRNLTFISNITTTSAVIQFISLGVNAGATDNAVKNCIIKSGSSTVTTVFGIYTGGTGLPSTSGTGAHNNNLTIQNNEIQKAYYGIYVSGLASTGLVTGLSIKDNIIGSDIVADYVLFNGVRLANTTGAFIEGNKIFNLKLATSVNNAAIELGANVTDAIVSGNEIFGIYSNSTSGYGAYGINISATTTSNITIVNNVIYDIITANYSLTSTSWNAFGIRITGGTNHKVYFNNVHLFGPVTAGTSNGFSAAFIVTSNSATGLDVRNNIFSNTTQFLNGAASKSYAAYVVTGTVFANINYNNYFSGGPSALFGFYGADKSDLAAWQASSGQDANSLAYSPGFASDTDLTPSSPYLNATADQTVPYYIDFNGVTRSTPPDFGAIEFNPPLCPDPSSLTAINLTPTTADLGWTPGFSETQWNVEVYLAGGVPGVDVPVASVTGTTSNPWQAINLTQYTDYEFYVQADCQTNGTSAWVGPFAFQTPLPALSGNYTINSTQPTAGTNFNSFTDFASYANLGGVSGSVIVDVVAGTGPYNEQVMFGQLLNSSALNTILIRGNGETLEYLSSNTNERATLKFNGTDFVTVDGLIVKALGAVTTTPAEYGWAVWLTNGADYMTFTDCEFHATTASTSLNFSAFVTSNSATSATTAGLASSYLTVTGCKTIGGYYGMVVNGPTTAPFSDGNMIIGNEISDFYLYGLYLRGQSNSMFNENEIHRTNKTVTGTTYMIYINSNMSMVDISKNQIYNFAGSGSTTSAAYGVYGTSVTAPAGEGMMFSNNAIWGYKGMNGTQYGFYLLTHTAATLVYHNTVSLDNLTHTGSSLIYCFYQTGANPMLDIQNNIFSYTTTSTGTKYNMYFSTTLNNVVTSNFNVLHRGSPAGTNNTGYWGAAFLTLANWQTANTNAFDQNSVDFDPIFGSPIPLSSNVDNIGTNLLGMVPEDINGTPRTPTPDPGAYEFEPVDYDIAMISGLLVRTTDCLNANDSIYLTIKNNIGGLIDFGLVPLTINWQVTGPISSSGTINVNSGTLASGSSLTVGSNGVNMSTGGTFVLSTAYISPNAYNQYTGNDTIYNAHSIATVDYTFNALPALTTIVSSADTVNLTVQSNVLAGVGSFFMTEICHYRGYVSTGWPSYLIADDYVEITGVPNSDLSGYTLEIWTASALESASVLGSGTVLSPNGTCIIATGQLSSSVPSPANYYYHSGATATQSSTTAKGYILRAPGGAIVDAVIYGSITFPAGAGVTANDWTGTTPAASSAGNRLEGPYTKNATNWINSNTSPQNPNVVNQNVSVPSPTGLTDFFWTLNGTTVAENVVDITVGPWITNGIYNYIASYTNQCGTFVDTAVVDVNIPPYDLVMMSIDSPDAELCYTAAQDVTITFKNIGSSTVNFPFTASYQVDSNTPVTETLTMTVAPTEIITHTFATQLNYTLTADTLFHLTTWVSLTGDNDLSNDTLDMDVLFKFSPDLPVGQPDTVNYNEPATLVATSNGLIYWYADDTSPAIIGTGDTLITPPLFATTNFYAAAASVSGGTLQVGTGTTLQSTAGITPYSSNWEGVRIQYLLRASELAALGIFPGDIISIAFDVTTAGTLAMNGYTIKMAHTNDAAFASAYGTPSGTWTQVYYDAALPVPAVGWNVLTFSTPFNWDGASNILIDICHENDPDGLCGTCYGTNSTVRATTTSYNSVYGRYNDNLPACDVVPTSAASTFTSRPNMMLNAQVLSCFTDRVPVEAYVNLPAIEPAVVSIELPLDTECYDGTNEVSIKITNNGTSTILTGLTASYQIDNGTPVTETVTTQIAQGDTIVFTFATPVALTLTEDITVELTTWVSHASDPYNANDTLSKSVEFGFVPPAPVAVDALNVPFGSTATLGATSTSNVNWYDSPSGTTVVGTGNTFVTPVLYNTTSYYAAAASQGIEPSGRATYAGTANTTGSNWGLVFDVVNSPTVIQTVDIYSVGAGGNITVQLQSNTGSPIATVGPFAYPAGTIGAPVTVTLPLNLTVPVGTGYRLLATSMNGNLIRESSVGGFPYSSPSGNVVVTNGYISGTSTTYYWFYNWQVKGGSGCSSDRVQVTAYVDVPSCIPIVAVDINNVTSTAADLSWAQAGTETAWQIEYDIAGFTPSGTPNHYVSGTPSTTLTNLTNFTDYHFYIRSDCGTETSAWWGPYSFTTLICDPADQCDYEFVLLDSWGDGWNGAQMQVIQYGIAVATLGFSSGNSFTQTVALCDGAGFEVYWSVGGLYPGECGLIIVSTFGDTLYNVPILDVLSVGTTLYTGTANCTPPVKTLNINAYLEGLYLFNGSMREAQGLTGAEFGAGNADEIVIELYAPSDLFTPVYVNTDPILLTTVGSASDDGIPYTLGDQYYIVIKNRNHIETWSATPVDFAGPGPIYYDFTTAAGQAYGNNQKSVSGGYYAIYAADANQDDIVDATDMSLIENASNQFLQGYNAEDLNGDGLVDGSDMLLIENNANLFIQLQKP